jgi:hypothetical protein
VSEARPEDFVGTIRLREAVNGAYTWRSIFLGMFRYTLLQEFLPHFYRPIPSSACNGHYHAGLISMLPDCCQVFLAHPQSATCPKSRLRVWDAYFISTALTVLTVPLLPPIPFFLPRYVVEVTLPMEMSPSEVFRRRAARQCGHGQSVESDHSLYAGLDHSPLIGESCCTFLPPPHPTQLSCSMVGRHSYVYSNLSTDVASRAQQRPSFPHSELFVSAYMLHVAGWGGAGHGGCS